MPAGKLYIGNLPPGCKEKELRELFGSFGDLEEVAIFNKEDGPGYAFVHYESQREADAALESLDNTEFNSYTLAVQISRTKGHGYGRGAGPPRPPGMRGPRDRDRPYRPGYRESERYRESDRYSGERDSYRGYSYRNSGGGQYYDSLPPSRRSHHSSRESRSHKRGRDHGDRFDNGYYDNYGYSHSRYRSRSPPPPPPKDYYRRYEMEYERERKRSYRDDYRDSYSRRRH